MFCGDMPCTCNAKPAKAKVARTPKAKPVETPKLDLRAAMKSAANEEPQVAPPLVVESVDDDVAAALVALTPILSIEDKIKYAPILTDTKLRARLWKERRTS
jgi:hypothetical protein